MRADIANKEADTKLKDEQRRWEPVKAMSAAFGAGVALSFGRADAVQRVAENTREELRGLSEMLSTMIKRVRGRDERIERLQIEVAELRGKLAP